MKMKRISFARVESKYGHDLPNLADMLRYDVAFQWSRDPGLIAFPTFHTKHGNLGGHCTAARWDSFGVRIRWTDAELGPDGPHAFVTYRHPQRKNGPTDYGRLVPVSLEAYMMAKSTDDLAVEP